MDTERYFKQKSEVLLNDITEIINGSWENSIKSNTIMERLRGETIFIPKSYLEELEKKQSKNCTIDPTRCLPLELSQLEDGSSEASVHEMIREGLISIKGNSFGPFFPEEYFKEGNFRILWLLKESFIEGPSFKASDRGAHNQAAEYAHYFLQYGNLGEHNETIPKLVEYSKQLLISLGELTEKCTLQE